MKRKRLFSLSKSFNRHHSIQVSENYEKQVKKVYIKEDVKDQKKIEFPNLLELGGLQGF